jgi:hypothetical protein
MHTDYFQPVSKGKYSQSTCGGGPEDKITIHLNNNVATTALAKIYADQQLHIYVTFEIPGQHTLRLVSNEFFVKTTQNTPLYVNSFRAGSAATLPSENAESGVIVLSSMDTLPGETYIHKTIWHAKEYHRSYNVNFEEYSLKAPERSLSLIFPDIFVDGDQVNIPIINFKRQNGTFIYTINC